MSKKYCSDKSDILKKSTNKKTEYFCKKCGEEVIKEKWVCKPKKIN